MSEPRVAEAEKYLLEEFGGQDNYTRYLRSVAAKYGRLLHSDLLARVEELERERDEARTCASWSGDIAEAAEARFLPLVRALKNYGQHKPGCHALRSWKRAGSGEIQTGECDCGFRAALAALAPPEEGKRVV